MTFTDSVKGIAIIGIFLVHNYVLGNINLPFSWMNSLISKGLYGVEITFIVNAYFYAKNFEKRVRNNSITPMQYIVKMILKTLPLQFCCM